MKKAFFALAVSLIIHSHIMYLFFNKDTQLHAVNSKKYGDHGITVGVGSYGSFIAESIASLPSKESSSSQKNQPSPTTTKKADEPPIPIKKQQVNNQSILVERTIKKKEVVKTTKKIEEKKEIKKTKENIITEEEKNSHESINSQLSQKKATGKENDSNTGGAVSNIPPGYLSKIVAKIQRYKRYPKESKKLKQEGTSYLKFTINKSGKITQSLIKKSSGYSLLDESTLNILKRVKYFPRFERSIKQQEITLVIPIEYTLIDH